MNGIINVYKEKGFTSHDVVAKLRGILHMKKIGHTGTLDPDAVGVLPVCVGKATKVCELLTDRDKTYVAEVRLGVTTDTLDLSGEILTEQPVQVTEEQLQEILPEFTGSIQQIPPMYSAIKINGKKLYELARQGQEVERKPRQVTIHELSLRQMNLAEQEFTMEVTCSKGTYIRSLCADIGERLGCGAAMKSLIRTRVGQFTAEQAMTLSEIEAFCRENEPEKLLLPIDAVFDGLARCQAGEKAMRFLENGNRMAARLCQYQAEKKAPENGEQVRMYGADGSFYAIYRYNRQDGMYHIVKMFH
ncbi:MAG: tRNA pseudouridine(55) synthase TruB [Lachnospiraceae bacterium]|nr:tRNA pseudouridine(55) synthase TruB [Lachnospiraceae bacterium]